jgi:hypothetical protein
VPIRARTISPTPSGSAIPFWSLAKLRQNRPKRRTLWSRIRPRTYRPRGYAATFFASGAGHNGKTGWRAERLAVVTLLQHCFEIRSTPKGGHDQAGIAPNFSIPSRS